LKCCINAVSRDRDGSGYPFCLIGRAVLKTHFARQKDMSGQPDPSGWKSQGKGNRPKN